MVLSCLYRFSCAALIGIALLPASARAAEWLDILPDESLKGWTRIPIPAVDGLKPKLQWRVDSTQKSLICMGDGGHEWLRYDTEVGDFVLQVEFRYTPVTKEPVKYNSGIGVRLSKYGELWVQAQAGYNGNFLFGVNFSDGTLSRFNQSKEMKENLLKPAGEWNLYEVRAQGDMVMLSVNGTPAGQIGGIGLRKGYIALEAEGYEIAFRNVKLKLLQ